MDKLVHRKIDKYHNKVKDQILINILPDLRTGREAGPDAELENYEKTMIKKIYAQENNLQKTKINTAHQRKIERLIK